MTVLKYLSTLTMKVLLIILPKHSLIDKAIKRKKKNKCEAAAQKGNQFRSLIGPLF